MRLSQDTMALLQIHLQTAVPLEIAEIKRAGREHWVTALEDAQRFTAAICGPGGEDLLHRGGQPGNAAHLVGELAGAIALMAFLPGGITTFGLHFEATFDEGESPFGLCHWDLRESNRHTWPAWAKDRPSQVLNLNPEEQP